MGPRGMTMRVGAAMSPPAFPFGGVGGGVDVGDRVLTGGVRGGNASALPTSLGGYHCPCRTLISRHPERWMNRPLVSLASPLVIAMLVATASTARAQVPEPERNTDLGIAVGMASPYGARLGNVQEYTVDGPLGGVDVAGGARRGFSALASLGFSRPGSPIGLRVEAQYTRFGLEPDPRWGPGGAPEVADGQVTSLSGTGNLVFHAPDLGVVRPYLIGGAGVYRVTSDIVQEPNSSYPGRGITKFGLNGGGGVELSLGRLRAFAEARYHRVLSEGGRVEYVPIVAGIRM